MSAGQKKISLQGHVQTEVPSRRRFWQKLRSCFQVKMVYLSSPLKLDRSHDEGCFAMESTKVIA